MVKVKGTLMRFELFHQSFNLLIQELFFLGKVDECFRITSGTSWIVLDGYQISLQVVVSTNVSSCMCQKLSYPLLCQHCFRTNTFHYKCNEICLAFFLRKWTDPHFSLHMSPMIFNTHLRGTEPSQLLHMKKKIYSMMMFCWCSWT